MPRAGRVALAVLVTMCMCWVLVTGTESTTAPVAGAETVGATPAPCVAVTSAPIDLPGSSTATIANTCQSSENDLTGGEQIPAASFAEPTTPGDLLVAAVLCGVLNGGMAVPVLSLPSDWKRAKKHTGGIQGGLEAAIFYQADNPGGITSVTLGHIPSGNNDVFCTTFTWEITGVGNSSSVDATGFASVIGGRSITVATSKATRHDSDLVLAAETDGSEYPPNQYQVSNHFDLISVWANGHTWQPGTFSALVTDGTGLQRTTVSQTSDYWWDSTAVVVALTI